MLHGQRGRNWKNGKIISREYDQEYTVRWILNEGIKHFPNSAQLYSVSADLELRCKMSGRAREMLRKGAKYNDIIT